MTTTARYTIIAIFNIISFSWVFKVYKDKCWVKRKNKELHENL